MFIGKNWSEALAPDPAPASEALTADPALAALSLRAADLLADFAAAGHEIAEEDEDEGYVTAGGSGWSSGYVGERGEQRHLQH